MKAFRLILAVSFLILSNDIYAQETYPIGFSISVAPEIQNQFKPSGRLFLFLSENPKGEPRSQLWPLSPQRNHIFAKNITGWQAGETRAFDVQSHFMATAKFNFDEVPMGTYHIQALWDQDTTESRIDAPGILYTEVKTIK